MAILILYTMLFFNAVCTALKYSIWYINEPSLHNIVLKATYHSFLMKLLCASNRSEAADQRKYQVLSFFSPDTFSDYPLSCTLAVILTTVYCMKYFGTRADLKLANACTDSQNILFSIPQKNLNMFYKIVFLI